MSKQTFHFGREHYIDETRHVAGSEASIDSAVASQLEKAGIGHIVKQSQSASAYGKGKSDKKS